MAAPFLLLAMLLQQGGAAVSSAPDQVIIELQEAIRKNPQVESNYTDLGNVLLRTQNFSEAALVLEAARSRFPRSAQAALSAGVAYYGLRRFSDSVTAFLDAGRLDPDAEQPVAFLNRMPEKWADRKDEIIALFKSYAEKHPRSALAHLALGRATGDVAELQQSIKLNPKNPGAYIELGAILETNRDLTGAIAAFRRAVELAPRNPIPHYRLSRLYTRTGDSARADAERALHEKLSAEEKAELDRRQAATQHLKLTVRP
jgi:cytochrome c-type biogenesis protein CcmH/NrfG